MQVSYIVSHINRVLVQDRILYDLHNTRELMIMQMREKREGSKREVKSDPAGTRADLEITERCRQDFGGCADAFCPGLRLIYVHVTGPSFVIDAHLTLQAHGNVYITSHESHRPLKK